MIEHWVDRIRLYGSVQIPGDHVAALQNELDGLDVSYYLQFDQATNLWSFESI